MPVQQFTLSQYVQKEAELLEYVLQTAQFYKPDFDFDEESGETYQLPSQAPDIFKVRYNRGLLKCPFTYQSYISKRETIKLITQLGLDYEKFWYLLLFIYDYCYGQFPKGWECTPSPKEELEIFCFSILDTYKDAPQLPHASFEQPVEITLKIGGKKIITMQDDAAMYLAALCQQHIDNIEAGSSMTNRQIKIGQNSRCSTATMACFFARMLITFFDMQKNIIEKRDKSAKGVSGKEKLLISHLIYLTGIISNDSLLSSYAYLKTLLKRYQNLPINSFNSIYM